MSRELVVARHERALAETTKRITVPDRVHLSAERRSVPEAMPRLVAKLREQQAEGARLDAAIAEHLEAVGIRGRGP